MFSYNPIAECCSEGVGGRSLLSQENPDSGAPAGPDNGSLSSGGSDHLQPDGLPEGPAAWPTSLSVVPAPPREHRRCSSWERASQGDDILPSRYIHSSVFMGGLVPRKDGT